MLKVSDFPTLKDLKGRTLITTDGTTLLGADDKAGVAEIITALEEIISSGMPHGDIWVGFTPDEEIGCGADLFDLDYFKAAFAYTVDGDYEARSPMRISTPRAQNFPSKASMCIRARRRILW